MKKILLLIIPIVVSIFLLGCVQTEVVCEKPYIKVGTECCLDQNDNRICDSDEEIVNDAQTASEATTPAEQPQQPPAQEEPVANDETGERPATVEVTMAGQNQDIGYLPEFTVVNGVTEGNSVEFGQSKIEILGVWNNAITVRVYGVYIGEKFTVAKGAPVDVNTKDGRYRMDFRDNNILYVQKIMEE